MKTKLIKSLPISVTSKTLFSTAVCEPASNTCGFWVIHSYRLEKGTFLWTSCLESFVLPSLPCTDRRQSFVIALMCLSDTVCCLREYFWAGGHHHPSPLSAPSASRLPQLPLQHCPLPAALLGLRHAGTTQKVTRHQQHPRVLWMTCFVIAGLLCVRRLVWPVRRLAVGCQSPVADDDPSTVLPSPQPSRREAPAVQPVEEPGLFGCTPSVGFSPQDARPKKKRLQHVWVQIHL